MPGRARWQGRVYPVRRHLLALVAGGLLPLVVVGAVGVGRLAEEERAATERRFARNAQALASALDREMTGSIRALQALAGSERLERGDLAGFLSDANRVDATQPYWSAIQLFTPEGERLVDTREREPLVTGFAVDPESLAEAVRTRRPTVGNVRSTRDGQQWAFAVRVPVVREDRVRYVVTALVSAHDVAEALALRTGGADREWTRTVVDREGRVVARTGDAARFVGQGASAAFLAETGAAPEGVFRDVTLEGVRSYVAFSHASLSGWTTAVAAPASVVEGPVRRSVGAVLILGLAALAVGAGGAFLLARRFAEALGSAGVGAEALALGGRPAIDARGIAEIARLGDALGRSADLLEARKREAEASLARAEAARCDAERANRAKDEFLAMLGHELRNPLSPIVAALELLRRRGTGWTHEHDVLARQAGHLVRLVDDLLDVARVTQGKITLERRRLEVSEAVARAVEIATPLLQARAHHLAVNVPPGLAVDADPVRLAQVISNLLTNAARYTPPGGHVRLDARRTGEGVSLVVSDDGQGMPPELLPRVFDLFTQGPRGRDRAEGGLGLGLTLVRTLVELHGGRVEARSPGPGAGSTFEVVLPAAAPATEPAAAQDAEPAPAAARPPRRHLRVLVVDDNTDAAELLADCFAQAGHDVTVRHDGLAALATALERPLDVIVLDVGLPGLDGWEVARRLRAAIGPAAPVVLGLSGYGQDDDVAVSRSAGFARHFVKPADPVLVLAAAEALAPPLASAG